MRKKTYRRISALLILALLCLSLASCSSEGSAPYYTAIENFYKQTDTRSFGEVLAEQEGYDADICAKDVIRSFGKENLLGWAELSDLTRTIDLRAKEENIFIRPFGNHTSYKMRDFYYLVRGVKTTRGRRAYAYTVFYEDREMNPGVLKAHIGYTFYSAIPLTAADFADIQPGDSRRKVEKIDPVTSLYLEELKFTIHLLDEGFMFIHYNEDKTVKELYYCEEGVLEPYSSREYVELLEPLAVPDGDRIY
ncbi:MAG: hypothetical protein IKL89_00005 [Clostridia bacterium]|nr:hypothetical protein [Clostridia bacterium]